MNIESKFAGNCSACRTPHAIGDEVEWKKGRKGVRCLECAAAGKTALGPRDKPLRDNQSQRVDCLARELPERAALAVVLMDKGAEPESLAKDLARIVTDLDECLANQDYQLRMRIPDADD